MWTKEQKSSEQSCWNTSGTSSRVSGNFTPRTKPKPNIPIPSHKKSNTPSKINDRLSSSPLRAPLQKAIEKCVNQKSLEKNSRMRNVGKSSRREELFRGSHVRNGHYEDEDLTQQSRRAHGETLEFLKKYFDFQHIIPIDRFIDRVFQAYEDLWSHQNTEQILDNFTYKVTDLFGVDGVDPKHLLSVTRDDGMIGLILQIFKSINQEEDCRNSNYVAFSKSPQMMSINKSFQDQINDCVNVQHIKNLIQEFMEMMYQSMETQIYNKFNVEMRRMVLKYRETERLVKKIQEKLTMHADIFDVDQKIRRKDKAYEESQTEFKRKIQKIEEELRREKENNIDLKQSKVKLEEQVIKLKENVDKFQNILINKFESFPSSESTIPMNPPTLRKPFSTSILSDRTQQFVNKQPQPFQIKIDTHFIQRDNGPPLTQTTTTFLDQNTMGMPNTNQNIGQIASIPMSYSPIKRNSDMFDSSRPSYESVKTNPNTNNMTSNIRMGDYNYSPYRVTNRPY